MPFINDMLAVNGNESLPAQGMEPFRFTFNPDEVIKSIKKSILGQDEVLEQLKDVLYCIKTYILDVDRPLSTLLFLGPTGVGKTETIRALAKAINNGTECYCRIDMNTLSQDHYAASLSGAPPGYSGSNESHSLFDISKIEGSYNTPGIVLFDEIEKASKEVIRTLLNILDSGEFSLANGKKNINFKNSIIIMTSNLGSKIIGNNNKKYTSLFSRKSNEQKILELLELRFDPEFINRIDRKIIYKKIDANHAIQIIELELSKLNKRVSHFSITVSLDKNAKLKINTMCDRRYGVRDIKRIFKVNIEPLVARVILHGYHTTYLELTVSNNQFVLKR